MGMNIVNSGSTFHIYGEEVKTYKALPIGCYEVGFSEHSGFFLQTRSDLETNEEKIYGEHEGKVNRVLKSFELSNRNFGVILSGKKGIGKSLFARILAQKGMAKNMPTIMVTGYIPGLSSFLGSIEQEVIVIFDEFEKTFNCSKNEETNPQTELLSLFDGLDNGKKLFVITCNELSKVSSYLLNRPGRFHYHFTIGAPTDNEIIEYMKDKLAEEFYPSIEKILRLAKTTNMTYDFLRAIAFELNQGYSLTDTLENLNISRGDDTPHYDIEVTLSNGDVFKSYSNTIDMCTDRTLRYSLHTLDGKQEIYIHFTPSNVTISENSIFLSPKYVEEFYFDSYKYYDMDEEEEKAAKEYDKTLTVSSVKFTKRTVSDVYRYMV